MRRLIEQDSMKAARILDSTRKLVIEHGIRKVTISEIAESAGVAKGTVYLYWNTKEDLVLGVFARELLSWIDKINAGIKKEPDLILPRRLAPLMIRTTLGNSWLRRLQDGDMLRLLSYHADNRERFAAASPGEMCHAAMPVLRDHGLVRDDRPLSEQIFVLDSLLIGFGTVMADPPAAGSFHIDDPQEVLADTVHQLLEPLKDPAEHIITAAAETVLARFAAIHENVFALIAVGSDDPA